MISWSRAQSQVPFNMYAQPSEKMASQILPSTKMQDLASFYSNSIRPSAKQTQQKSIRKRFQCVHHRDWKKNSLGALDCRFPTCLPCNLLCMSILKYLKVPAAEQRQTTILCLRNIKFFRRQAHWSQRPRTRIIECHLVDLRKAEKRWKDGHHHSNGFG